MFQELILPGEYEVDTKRFLYGGDFFVSDGFSTRSCREEFREFLHPRTVAFYYNTATSGIERIISNITEIETRLNLTEEQRIKFQKTTCKTVIRIIPSTWWMEEYVRREFLTAVIKSSGPYILLGIDNLVKKSKYFGGYGLGDPKYKEFADNLLNAANKFLDGATKISPAMGNEFDGWCFSLRSGENLQHLI